MNLFMERIFKMFNKEDMINITNDVKEIMIYSIEGSIYVLKKVNKIIEKIDFDKIFNEEN